MSKKLDIIVHGGGHRSLGLLCGRAMLGAIRLTDLPDGKPIYPAIETEDFFERQGPYEEFQALLLEFRRGIANCMTNSEKREVRRAFKLKAKRYRWFVSTRMHEYETWRTW